MSENKDTRKVIYPHELDDKLRKLLDQGYKGKYYDKKYQNNNNKCQNLTKNINTNDSLET